MRYYLCLNNSWGVKSRECVLCYKSCTEAVNRLCTHVNIFNLKSIAILKINRTEDAHSNESVNPVPTVCTLYAAGVYSVACKSKATRDYHTLNRLYRRGELYAKKIIFFL